MSENWEAVIGLEVHIQLNTKTKLFSPAPNLFGQEPNTNITEICTGQPGALPILNKEAVTKAIQFGLAIDAQIARVSIFDRKSYFYPDSPRNFQITQYESPIVVGGMITADIEGVTKQFSVHRAHLEDDAGMLKHFTHFAGVDYNRAGVPLIEVVSEPCMHSPKEAVAYAMAIKAIAEYLDISDCNMEEGSLRFDANISVRPKGEKELRPKTEIKNMNSFAYMEMALELEIRRQIKAYLYQPNESPKNVIRQSTYRFDTVKKEVVLMRSKEEAEDYRYFPEPDLPPILVTDSIIEEARKSLPELPHQRFQRYLKVLGLPADAASLLINEKKLADYFEEGLTVCPNARALCNWMTVEFIGRLKESGTPLWLSGIRSEHIANLVNFIDTDLITGKIAKKVADEMVKFPGKDSNLIIKENPDFIPIYDQSSIEPVVDEVIAQNISSIEDYKAGKTKAFDRLVGQVMQKMKGKASPVIVRDLLLKKIS